jgi:gliding motility-associated-like protein
MKTGLLYLCLFGCLSIWEVSGQHIQVNDSYSAEQLINVLVNNSCAQVTNSNLYGSPNSKSYGYFTNASPAFPLGDGIILSTGYATSATGPNSSLLSEGLTTWPGDADLEAALGVSNTINATILEFDFIPYTDKISFDYIFSSEQYLTSITSQNQCNYTDGFAFLIKETGSTLPYVNLALVPGTTTPVKVNTVRGQGVCPADNEEYFGGFNPTEHPTNFNGQTVVLQAKTSVIAGTSYHIKLVIADQGNNLYDSAIFLAGGSFKNVTDLGTDRLLATGNPLCTGETMTLDATTLNATGYKWYKDGILQNITSATYIISSAGEYTVDIQFGISCIAKGEITIETSSPPAAGNFSLIQCDRNDNGSTVFNLDLAYNTLTGNDSSLYVYYYPTQTDAENSTNQIIDTAHFVNSTNGQIVYAKVLTPYSCYSISTLTLSTSVNNITQPTPLGVCDYDGSDDGYASFDLSSKTSEILQNLPQGLTLQYFVSYADALSMENPINNTTAFLNTTAYNQVIYARIYNGSDCFDIAELPLIVYSFGNSLNDEEIALCQNDIVTLDAGTGYSAYQWNTTPPKYSRFITINKPGTYSVTVTNANDCEGVKDFTVFLSEQAINARIEVNDFHDTHNWASVFPTGIGNYEFSLNGNNYHDSNTFSNLLPGEYKAYIRDKNGCGLLIVKFYVLNYPKFFTPNNDGVDDVWRIPYLSFMPDAEIHIFDRYGKLITGFKGSGSWDGTFNGTDSPATDYWFELILQDRSIKGHFSLLR